MMAVEACAHGTTIVARLSLFDVTAAAEVVELRFDHDVEIGGAFVTIDAETITAVVGEIMVAFDAILTAVIGVGECDRQALAAVALLGGRKHHGADHQYQHDPESARHRSGVPGGDECRE